MRAISLCLVYESKRFGVEIERSAKCVRAGKTGKCGDGRGWAGKAGMGGRGRSRAGEIG